jgi:hypothetical protein
MSNVPLHDDYVAAQIRMQVAIEAQEFSLVALLNPKVFIDGDQWCVLYGENLQDGVAGFGETPAKAVYAFDAAWRTKLKQAGAKSGESV